MEKPAIRLELADDGVEVDADVLTKCFQISDDALRQGMREGSITSRFEKGEGEDEGKIRLTFFSANCRVRITADAKGKLLSCNTLDFGKQPLPAALRGT